MGCLAVPVEVLRAGGPRVVEHLDREMREELVTCQEDTRVVAAQVLREVHRGVRGFLILFREALFAMREEVLLDKAQRRHVVVAPAQQMQTEILAQQTQEAEEAAVLETLQLLPVVLEVPVS